MARRNLRPSAGFELWWWYFMRVSGLLLVVLALGHLCITHILNNVENINYAFVANRWTNPKTGVIWRLWDLCLINLAVLHGFNGLRQILAEWIESPSRRKLASTLLWIACISLIGAGSYSILNFQKDEKYLREFYDANPELRAENQDLYPVHSAPIVVER